MVGLTEFSMILDIILVAIVIIHIYIIRKSISKVDEHILMLDNHMAKVEEYIDYIKWSSDDK